MPILDDINMDAPISLQEAAEVLLRGLVRPATLRAAADRGELNVYKIGKRIITTRSDIEDWWKQCRVNPKVQGSTYSQNSKTSQDISDNQSGLSETEAARLSRDAALARVKKLKENSQTISQPNTSQPAASVHYLPSGSQT